MECPYINGVMFGLACMGSSALCPVNSPCIWGGLIELDHGMAQFNSLLITGVKLSVSCTFVFNA
jgi:hypothetical protein